MDDQERAQWISIHTRKPNDCKQYLCYMRYGDMGGASPWFDVLYYDGRVKKWCESDPTQSDKVEYISDWYLVSYWRELPDKP